MTIALVSGSLAALRFVESRRPPPPQPAVLSDPASGPVGTKPLIRLAGWPRRENVRVLFCVAGKADQCHEMGTIAPPRKLKSAAIPATVPAPGGTATIPVAPGRYDLRASSGEGATPRVRGRFEVVPFGIAAPPSPRPLPAALESIVLGAPAEVARGLPCAPGFTPDGRLILGRSLLDPSNGATFELPAAVQGSQVAWSPARDRLAMLTADRKEISVAAPDGSSPEVVFREPRGLLSGLSWSHEGDKLAFATRPEPGVSGGPRGALIVVLSLLDGTRQDAGPGLAATFSPVADRLAIESAGAVFVSDAGGPRKKLADGGKPSWSPDGSALAYIRGSESGELRLVKADDPQQQRALLEEGTVCGAAFSPDGRRIALTARAGGTVTLLLRQVDVRGAGTPRP
ncbi:MAG TPA: hypothetical protein VNE62_05605 [Actinomycetota bacterium]|nr:hypothetical protein [Actinomycetota bacterium]